MRSDLRPLCLLVLSCLGCLLPLPATRAAGERPLTPADRAHWAFRKPVRPAPPAVRDPSWVRTPIDAFVLARLEQAGLKPAPDADRAALLRRVALDLTGLPPTPQEVDDFLHDARPGAYERMVERLLASPHYGERWAQHWLDVVRFAESNGYEADAERPHAHGYRDYVIRAFNDDLPYDRFVTEQLAGDLLWKDEGGRVKDESAKKASASSFILHPSSFDPLVATGFNLCGPVHVVGGNTDPEVNRQEVLTEMTTAVGSAFVGLTLGCARCHDHKFDPVSQRDYYRLQAFFAATTERDVDVSTPEQRAAHDRQTQELNAQLAPLREQAAKIEAPYQARLTEAKKAQLEPKYRAALAVEPKKRTPEQARLAADAEPLVKVTWDELVAALSPADRDRRAALRARIHDLEAQLPPPAPHAWAVADGKTPPATYVLKRGDPKKKDVQVRPGFPRVLVSGPAENAPHNRLDLARWLVAPDNPLTARVLVNRLWQHHFGRGLVVTPNDFGLRGMPPSHPELLDWLACELREHGWSVKHLQRLLVLSAAYRQDCRPADAAAARRLDPDNRLLGHMNRQRLEGEALRDCVLAVAGTLNPAVGGPSVRVPLEPAVYELIFTEGEPDGLWHVTPDPRQHTRRSLYLFAKRNLHLPLFEAFDQPDTLTSCPVRPVSTFAPQALILLNGPFLQRQSQAFAARLLRECGPDQGRQVERAYRLALARPPRPGEAASACRFLAEQTDWLRARREVRPPAGGLPKGVDAAEAAALADFCLAMFNRNEFLYPDGGRRGQ
jgi:hypothetical protein